LVVGADFNDFSLLQSSALADTVAAPTSIVERTTEKRRVENDRGIMVQPQIASRHEDAHRPI
jgi:ABC-type ATPase involved in cell division